MVRARKYSALAAHDDGPLQQIGVVDENRDQLVVQHLTGDSERSGERFLPPDYVSGRQPQFLEQFAQQLSRQWVLVVVDGFDLDASLLENADGIPAGASRGLQVDRDLLVHCASLPKPWSAQRSLPIAGTDRKHGSVSCADAVAVGNRSNKASKVKHFEFR